MDLNIQLFEENIQLFEDITNKLAVDEKES